MLIKLLWLLLLVVPISAFAQKYPVDTASGKIYYIEEVLVKDAPQSDLYHRAKAWLSRSGKCMGIDQGSADDSRLLSCTNYSFFSVKNGKEDQGYKLWHTITIEMEDDVYWFKITDLHVEQVINRNLNSESSKNQKIPLEAFVFSDHAGKLKSETFQELIKTAAHKNIVGLIKDLQEAMR